MTAQVDVHALAAEIAALVAERQAPAPQPLLDAKAAGELLNVPASWCMAEARAGRLPHVKVGPKYTRFRAADLVAWLDRQATR
jgi:hypothetical protein